MPWLQLHCQTDKAQIDEVNDFLEAHDCLSLTWQDAQDNPILEPLPGETPMWEQMTVTALFDADTDVENIASTLRKSITGIQHTDIETLQDQVWERSWLEHFHPMQFGEKLWIYPSTSEIPDDDTIKVILDPGLAFGTGTHPTTALCMEWLDQNPPVGKTVIDYGCGSGILALAALKLGATQVIATDIDPQALTATRDNLERNALSQESLTTCLPEHLKTPPADLLLANILSGPLTELAPVFASLLKPSAQIVLSGILEEQEEAIAHAYRPLFSNLTSRTQEGWLRISGIRKPS